jgi:hypothetical protein
MTCILQVTMSLSDDGSWPAQALQQRNGAMGILNVGGMDVSGQREAAGISNDVPLAAGSEPATGSR